jgi:hypothetical protein
LSDPLAAACAVRTRAIFSPLRHSREGVCAKSSAASSTVMAGLDRAIQLLVGFFMDGPVKPGNDN